MLLTVNKKDPSSNLGGGAKIMDANEWFLLRIYEICKYSFTNSTTYEEFNSAIFDLMNEVALLYPDVPLVDFIKTLEDYVNKLSERLNIVN